MAGSLYNFMMDSIKQYSMKEIHRDGNIYSKGNGVKFSSVKEDYVRNACNNDWSTFSQNERIFSVGFRP